MEKLGTGSVPPWSVVIPKASPSGSELLSDCRVSGEGVAGDGGFPFRAKQD